MDRTVLIEPSFDAQEDYDDKGFTQASIALHTAVGAMVEAGADSSEIEDAIENGLSDAIESADESE